MATVAILGAGDLGGAVAHALAARRCVHRIVLLDAGSVAAGKALDIQQAGAIDGFHTRLEGTSDWSRVIGAAVCVFADPLSASAASAEEDGFAQWLRAAPFIADAPVVFAGAGHAGLMHTAVREGGLRRQRAIGSASEALVSAVRSIVAVEARCSPAEVLLTVVGAPPDGFVVPWSEAAIGGFGLERVLTPVQRSRVEARVARLWPPGPYALGQAAAAAVEAVLSSSRRALSLLAILDGELGVRDRIAALPALLAPTGIVHTRLPSLSARERVQLETALAGR